MRPLHDFLVFWGLKRPTPPGLVASLVSQWHDALSAVVSCDQRRSYWTAESRRFANHLTNLEAQIVKAQADMLRFKQLQKEMEDDDTSGD